MGTPTGGREVYMRSLRVGSVLGFEIRLDYSWFIVFFLILWTFAAAVFPVQAPGRSPAVYLGMGLVGSVLFFASLLAHEVSHSLVARARGIPMEGITLFVFRGMARTRAESRSPGDEFVIAGVGPLTSLGIALLLGAVGWLGMRFGWSAVVVVVVLQLALLNLVLAIFNLLPGFPLDGGRLLRAAVWKLTGSVTRATRVAASGGKGIGLLLIGLGIWQILTINLLGGVWMILIGAFLRTAAESGYLQSLLSSTLAGVTVSEVMTPAPVTVSSDLSLEEFVDRFLLEGRHLGYPVVENGLPVGLVSLHGVRKIPRSEWSSRTVGAVMVPLTGRLTAGPDESMNQVLEKLTGAPTGRLLVLEDHRVAGIVTRSDLTRWLERARLLEGA